MHPLELFSVLFFERVDDVMQDWKSEAEGDNETYDKDVVENDVVNTLCSRKICSKYYDLLL